ncbi:MAG TPA: protein kinase [Thermoanaerobaculia bacterium]|nr:protein kinase [Thermoanaerobaculia bacterium]
MGNSRRITENYRLDKLVHSSGAGSVFCATDLRSGETLAIKLISAVDDKSEEQCQAFQQLAEALRAVHHPGIPRTLDFGFTTAGTAFLVSEFCSGVSLELFARSAPASALALAVQVAEALEALAAQGFGHRNLRADNVLVLSSSAGASGETGDRVVLLGLGSAAAVAAPDGGAADRRALAELTCLLLGASYDATASQPQVVLPASAVTLADAAALRAWLEAALGSSNESTGPGAGEAAASVFRRALGPRSAGAGEETTRVSRSRPHGQSREPSAAPIPGATPPEAFFGAGPEERTVRLASVDPRSGPDTLTLSQVAAPGPAAADHPPKAKPFTIQMPLEPPLTAAAVADSAPPDAATAALPSAAPPTSWAPAAPAASSPPAGLAAGLAAESVTLVLKEPQRTVVEDSPEPSTAEVPNAPSSFLPQETEATGADPATASEAASLPPAPPAAGLAADSATGVLRQPWQFPASEPPLPPAELEREIGEPASTVASLEGRAATKSSTADDAATAMAPDFAFQTVHQASAPTATKARSEPARESAAGPAPPVVAGDQETVPRAAALSARSRSGLGRRLLPAILGAGLAALGLALMLLVNRGGGAKPPSARVRVEAPRPAPKPVAPPSTTPAHPPAPEHFNPQIELAEADLAAGKLAPAREALAAITAEQRAAFSTAERDRFQKAAADLDRYTTETVAKELRNGLVKGSLNQLTTAIATAKELIYLPAEVQTDLDRAKRAVALNTRMARAQRSHSQAEVLTVAAELQQLLPSYTRAAQAREQAAGALEASADAAAASGQFDRAHAELEQLRSAWPDRPLLAERLAKITTERQADAQLEALLAGARRSEQSNQPLDGLDLLASAKPNRRYGERFRQQQERLRELLARLDSAPPKVALRDGTKLEYERGKTARVPLRVTDDFQVKSVECWARAEDGSYKPVGVRHGSGADYTVEIPESLHGNKPVEFYVTASDLSGHLGMLGTSEKPLKLKRKGWFSKLIGREHG